jgi:hypothetical protein
MNGPLIIQRDRHRRHALTLKVDIEHHNVRPFIRKGAERFLDGRRRVERDTAEL